MTNKQKRQLIIKILAIALTVTIGLSIVLLYQKLAENIGMIIPVRRNK